MIRNESLKTVVIGAGVAGLYVTREMVVKGKEGGVLLIEKSGNVGGRARTEYSEESVGGERNEVLFETGPWRVPDLHERVLSLLSEYGLSTRPAATPPLKKKGTFPPPIQGLTTWESNAVWRGSSSEADKMDIGTGYAGETHSAGGTAPYETESKTFLIVEEGVSRLMDRMAEGLPIRLKTRVENVEKVNFCSEAGASYRVSCVERVGRKEFRRYTLLAKEVVVCVPPSFFREWSIFKENCKSLSCSVKAGELHHIYAKCDSHPRGKHIPSPLLSQTVSTQYGNGWYQASYSGGRVARLWHNLLLASPSSFLEALKHHLSRLSPPFKIGKEEEVRSHYWHTAYHSWLPSPFFSLEKAVYSSVVPNQYKIPGVYVCGEAFSSYQAWMEGALETAEMAVDEMRLERRGKGRKAWERRELEAKGYKEVVWLQGYPVHASPFFSSHPGGRGALESHLWEDVEEYMEQVGHSFHAWAVANSLRIT